MNTDRPLIQLSRRGVRVDLQAGDLERLQADWRRQHFIRLPQLFDAELVALVQAGARRGPWEINVHPYSGTEQVLNAPSLIGMIDFQFNTPALLRLAESVSGCGHIGAFFGRIYRLTPGTDEGHDWHGDLRAGRRVAVSVNLSEGVFEGGELQLRATADERPLGAYANTGLGDCVLFRLGTDVEHRVLPVTGAFARQAYAGWFLSEPEYASTLKRG